MSRGHHNSPQTTTRAKRRKSFLKTQKLIKQNQEVLLKLK